MTNPPTAFDREDRGGAVACADGVVPGQAAALAAERLAALDVAGLDDEAALAAVAECEKVIAFACSVQVRALARFAQLRPADDPDRRFSEFAADELAPVMAWNRATAAKRLAHSVELTGRLAPALVALEHGQVDLYKTRILTESTAPLTDEQTTVVVERVLPRAAGQNPTAFRRAVRRAVLRIDPHGQDRRHETARANRRVVLTALPDGMAELTATLPAEKATAIYHRVDTLARTTDVPGDVRGADARRADAFTTLLLHNPADTTGAARPLVQITVPASTLLGLDQQPGDLAGYGPVPAAMARRIAADPTGTWRRLITDPADGTLLDYGRRIYRPPAALADHVTARDMTCRFPGCHQQARTADLDHTVPYPEGPTAAGNLGALCRHHRRLKHHTRWTVHQQDGHFVWTSPTGRQYTVTPTIHAPPDAHASTTPATHLSSDSRLRRLWPEAS